MKHLPPMIGELFFLKEAFGRWSRNPLPRALNAFTLPARLPQTFLPGQPPPTSRLEFRGLADGWRCFALSRTASQQGWAAVALSCRWPALHLRFERPPCSLGIPSPNSHRFHRPPQRH